jgi:hypothetical protein
MAGIRKVDTPKIPVLTTTKPAGTPTPATSTTPASTTLDAKAVAAAAKARLDAEKHTDATTTTQLGATADKAVADKVAGQAASANQLDKQAAITASHDGRAVAKNELSPEFKLAKQLTRDLAGQFWADKAPPELKAIHEAIGPQVSALATQTAASVMSDPNAMANLAQLSTKLGSDGFKAAVQTAGKDVAGHFLQTAGVQAKNPEAIKAALSGIEALAPKIGGSAGAKLAETAGRLGPKLLGDGAAAAAATTTVAKASGAAAKAATTGAAGAATAAKAGGQALPVIGNLISVGSTLLAGANLIGQIAKKPHDVEKILKEGVNTLTQGVGIAFPWVGLGGTLVDAAWGAKTSVSDQKKAAQGIPVTENANVAAALPLLGDSADILHAALKGAGKHDAADKLATLSATTKTMAQLDLNKPGDRLSLLRKDEQQALIALAHESKQGLQDVAAAESGPRKQALVELASGFGSLADVTLATMRYDKREGSPGFDEKAKKDLETKRNELAGQLAKQLGNASLAEMLRRAEERGVISST